MFLTLAWRNIWRNKRRTFITVASIGFAVFFASMLTSVQEGTFERAVSGIVGQSLGFVQIHKQGYWQERSIDNAFRFTETIEEATHIDNLGFVMIPRLEGFALASYETRSKAAMVLGIAPDVEEGVSHLSEKVVLGTSLNRGDEGAVLGAGLAEYLGVAVGDTLAMLGQGYHGVSAAGKYVVQGVVKLGAPELNNQVLYLPMPVAQKFYGAEGLFTSLTVDMEASGSVEAVQERLKTALDTTQYEVMTWIEMAPEIAGNIELDRKSRSLMILVLYVIIGFGIFGTFLMMTKERSYEFGVTIAIGMRRFQLIRVVMLEIAFLAVLGALAGAAIAMPLTAVLSQNPIPLSGSMGEMSEEFGQEAVIAFAFVPRFYLSQAVTILLLSLLLAVFPIWNIFRTKVVSAMRG